jgi:hypothetical protein
VGLEDDPLNAARFHPGENAGCSKESADIHHLKNTVRDLLRRARLRKRQRPVNDERAQDESIMQICF